MNDSSETKNNKKKKKKGLWSVIRESMVKTGGCCGPGETCGGSTKETPKRPPADEEAEESDEADNKTENT